MPEIDVIFVDEDDQHVNPLGVEGRRRDRHHRRARGDRERGLPRDGRARARAADHARQVDITGRRSPAPGSARAPAYRHWTAANRPGIGRFRLFTGGHRGRSSTNVRLLSLRTSGCLPGRRRGSSDRRLSSCQTLGDCLLSSGYTALALRQGTGPHLEARAAINGVYGRFLIHTGAQITVVSRTSLEKFHLKAVKTGVRVYGAVGGPGERIEAALASTFEIGPCATSPFLLGVSDLSALNQGRHRRLEGAFDGIIGADVLQNFSFVIDCAGLRLYAKQIEPQRAAGRPSALAPACAGWDTARSR